MRKTQIDNVTIQSNQKITQKSVEVFTEYGYKRVTDFTFTNSTDFRNIFEMLWENYQTQPLVFYKPDFRKFLEKSKSFAKFVLAAHTQPPLSKIAFDKFYLPLIQACYENYQTNGEVDARSWVVGTLYSLLPKYPEYGNFISELIHSLDVTENINSGRVIYVDKYLALTYNKDTKNGDLGELLFAARNSSNLWNFDKTDIFVPVKSLHEAKSTLTNYQKQPRRGELLGNDAARFSNFLGLEIRENYAYMHNYQETKNQRGKGFKK
ncbi:MAG: hypothetical protein V7K77_09370 [Nostoc sp.]|uniref:hypothetical protein n=1 Tax=Nostoc sp. TaxID=1180 RepID=UPI002FFD2A39